MIDFCFPFQKSAFPRECLFHSIFKQYTKLAKEIHSLKNSVFQAINKEPWTGRITLLWNKHKNVFECLVIHSSMLHVILCLLLDPSFVKYRIAILFARWSLLFGRMRTKRQPRPLGIAFPAIRLSWKRVYFNSCSLLKSFHLHQELSVFILQLGQKAFPFSYDLCIINALNVENFKGILL